MFEAFDVDATTTIVALVHELLIDNGDGLRVVRADDGNRLGLGDMGAIGGAEFEFAFILPAKWVGISFIVFVLPLGLCNRARENLISQ